MTNLDKRPILCKNVLTQYFIGMSSPEKANPEKFGDAKLQGLNG